MTILLNKPRALEVVGLDPVNINVPVAEWSRMQNNNDGTVTVIIDFYKDQIAYDNGVEPFETKSFQINIHPNVDTYLRNELKLLADFDQI